MNINATKRPLILIDFKKPRIRIHRNVLHVLDNPECILLLVNPIERLIAIKTGDRTDPRAHHIARSVTVHKKSFEIYSTSFIRELRLCGDWEANQKYRIYGDVIKTCGLVQFKIDESFKYSNTDNVQEGLK